MARGRSRGLQPDGEQIQRLRRDKGWTQKQLADEVGFAKKTVERLENGEPTRRQTLQVVADALGVRVEDLLVREGAVPDSLSGRVRAWFTQLGYRFRTGGEEV